MFQTSLMQGIAKEEILLESPPISNLNGKVVIISGATSGIGRQAALRFAEQHCFVIGIGRSEHKIQEAINSIKEQVPYANIDFVLADLSSQQQIHRAVQDIKTILDANHLDHIDLLINNAGTFAGKLIYTEEGFERTLAINHLAPFLLTHLLLPLLQNSEEARILTVSSGSHYKTWLSIKRLNKPFLFIGLWAYKTTKLCNVLFTQAFNQHHRGSNVRAYAVDPGLVNTNIGFKGTGWLPSLVWSFRQKSATSPELSVKTMLYLASKEKQYNNDSIYWKDSQPRTPSIAARNSRLAEELWQASLQWCQL